MLHAATMTASHFHRSEVAMWQLHAAALTATHWGFPQERRKDFGSKGVGMDPVLTFGLPRTFRGASANVVCPDMLLGLLARMVPRPKKTCS